MIVNLDVQDARPIYLQIIDEVRRALVVGSLRPEDPLPSVRELASELRVNPRTVSQAYQELERAGVVYVRRGEGTFVSADALPGPAERRALADRFAKKILIEARRSGIGLEELSAALRRVAGEETAAEGGAGQPEDAVAAVPTGSDEGGEG